MPSVKVDHTKCRNALDCRACLDLCPGGVLIACPVKGRPLGMDTPWQIKPALLSLCTGCRACERGCPDGAIKVRD